MEEIKISVGSLAEEWGRRGDLNRPAGSFGTAVDGIRLHRRIQKKRPSGYLREVMVSHQRRKGEFLLQVSGKIDGIYADRSPIRIEEIKTTSYDLEEFVRREESVHWSQAMIYGYLYARRHQIKDLEIQVTCCSLRNKDVVEKVKTFSFRELEEYFLKISGILLDWFGKLAKWREKRNHSLTKVPFPFASYRKGQRDLAVQAWKAMRQGRQMLVQSPTGTGKTAATLYPAVKMFPYEGASKIIYLTAKTTGQKAAESCLDLIRAKGGQIKSVTLSAKERICPGNGICTGEECELARGYYDRLVEARELFFTEDDFTRSRLEEISLRHRICPWAFSRELHRWADCVVCDLNYVFDPAVASGVLPGEIEKSALIIDESHNLADRARENFSASLDRSLFLEPAKRFKRKRKLKRMLKAGDERFQSLYSSPNEKAEEPDPLFLGKLRDLALEIEKILTRDVSLSEEDRQSLFESWSKIDRFLQIAQQYSPSYQMLFQPEKSQASDPESTIKLFCIDPSSGLREVLERCRSAIFLSGTLKPMEYYRQLNGCDRDSLFMELPSPYPPEHLLVLVYQSISTRYLEREATLTDLTRIILDFINSKKGNYLVFFPSYAYLDMAANELDATFKNQESSAEIRFLRQFPGMNETEKLSFLAEFSTENRDSLVGLAVMGGAFGEGIDLVGERLAGAVIVGVGLPGISDERESIRKYFNSSGQDGFNFSYLVPGMTRVLQAAGRVIRSENDRGAILLIDDRFTQYRYRSLFPNSWNPIAVKKREEMKKRLEGFWSNLSDQV